MEAAEPEPEPEPQPRTLDSVEPTRTTGGSALKPAREVRTVWVGGVPEALARDEPRLADMFQQFGDVETITARVKMSWRRACSGIDTYIVAISHTPGF